MAQDELMDFRAGGLAIPALFVALLALLGVVNLPGRGVSPPALPGASSTEVASGASSVGETVPRPSEGCRDKDSTLAILKPLERFYALRLERFQFQKKDSAGRVRWMLDGTKTCDDLEVLIAVVPDPIQSGSAHLFDITINAILLAMRRAGYLLDSFQLQDWKSRPGPWTPPLGVRGALLSPRGVDLSIGEGAPRDPDERLPGLILLRKYPNPAKPKKLESHALIALVLVAETPIRGVHPKMLQQGLDLAASVWTARLKSENAPAAGPIAGSSDRTSRDRNHRLCRTVRSWLEARKQDLQLKVKPYTPAISWINGQALSLNPELFDESFSDIWQSAVQFQSVAYGSRDLNFRLFIYLADHCTPLKGGDRVAYLTEETTGFGYRFVERIRLMESKRFDLKLKRSLNDVSGIPKEDEKNLIIVADVNHVLHFRIFDGDGKVVVNTDEKSLIKQARDEKRLTEQAQRIKNLRARFAVCGLSLSFPRLTRTRSTPLSNQSSITPHLRCSCTPSRSTSPRSAAATLVRLPPHRSRA